MLILPCFEQEVLLWGMRLNTRENIFQLPHPQLNSCCSQGRITNLKITASASAKRTAGDKLWMEGLTTAYHLFWWNSSIILMEYAVGKNCVVLRCIAIIAEVKVQKMWAIDANAVFSTHGLRTPLANTCSEFAAIRNIASIHRLTSPLL